MHHRRLPGGPSYTFNLLAQTRQSSGREKTLAGRRGKRGEREGGCSADKSSHVVNDVHLHYLPSSLGLIDAVIHHCYRATTDGGGGGGFPNFPSFSSGCGHSHATAYPRVVADSRSPRAGIYPSHYPARTFPHRKLVPTRVDTFSPLPPPPILTLLT